METAAEETVVEAVMQTTSTGITKTNLKNTIHHFGMARKSIDRAFGLLGGMTDGRSGRIATTLGTGITTANSAVVKLIEAEGIVRDVQLEIEELYG